MKIEDVYKPPKADLAPRERKVSNLGALGFVAGMGISQSLLYLGWTRGSWMAGGAGFAMLVGMFGSLYFNFSRGRK